MAAPESTASRALRLWPGVVIVILQWLLRFVVPAVFPDTLFFALIGGLFGGGLAIVLWWLFFSRAPWSERLGAVALMVAGMVATKRIVHVSLATGAQGMLLYFLAIPGVCLAFVVWAVATRHLSDRIRRATMVATILLASGVWALVRTGGFTAATLHHDLHWRWTPTPEERLVAQSRNLPTPAPVPKPVEEIPAPAPSPGKPLSAPSQPKSEKKPASLPLISVTPKISATPDQVDEKAVWPGFRGPHRDGVVAGVQIKTDWTTSPPVAMWRRPVGPGWSSFAVRGDFIYTQEQRGSDEVVACYRLTTGEPVWAHRDAARFWESNGGPGPRGTPTLSNGRVYTFGATGIVNALDASSGAALWSRNAASEAAMEIPTWGFASSPLVVGDLVIVGVAGRLVAYDHGTGVPRWLGPARGMSYSSPRLLTVDGVAQVLLLSATGATSVALADGALLWEHPWKGYPIVQPNLTEEGDILLSVSDSSGIRRLALAHTPGSGPGGWTVAERWTSTGLKPYFNDFVVHHGHAYGFDGSILSCIDLKDGARKWKGGRYGNGQLVLLADQDLLLVLSEEGELALVQAMPDRFTELARFPAIEGKTWNHPVLVGNVLLVRNGEQMVAFRLSLANT
jgi:outer membrane protein assembly factor BamB